MTAPLVTVVGIGEDGIAGLSDEARAVIASARHLVGGRRHLDLVPKTEAKRTVWATPLSGTIDAILAEPAMPVVVLASGDPMLYGVGATLAKRIPADRLRVIPAPSAFAIACARLLWAEAETTLVAANGRRIEGLHPSIQPGRQLIVYTTDGKGPASVAALLDERGFGNSPVTVFERIGGPGERRTDAIAATLGGRLFDDLNLIAVTCVAGEGAILLPTVAGLPDDAYLHDGQFTKRELRAAAIARLAPMPGQLLWDVGSGSGSVGIEWMRAIPDAFAVAIDRRPDRLKRTAENAARLGVPALRLVEGEAPAALADLPPPDAVFIGGGLTSEGLLERCWSALRPGGRIVAHAVTLEGETILGAAYARLGGELTRIAVSRADAVGSMTGWRPQMAVTQWAAIRR